MEKDGDLLFEESRLKLETEISLLKIKLLETMAEKLIIVSTELGMTIDQVSDYVKTRAEILNK